MIKSIINFFFKKKDKTLLRADSEYIFKIKDSNVCFGSNMYKVMDYVFAHGETTIQSYTKYGSFYKEQTFTKVKRNGNKQMLYVKTSSGEEGLGWFIIK